jgi:hypothetical protein
VVIPFPKKALLFLVVVRWLGCVIYTKSVTWVFSLVVIPFPKKALLFLVVVRWLGCVIYTKSATWVFSLVVIPFPKKALPLYEGVGSIIEIFKIYMCVSLD